MSGEEEDKEDEQKVARENTESGKGRRGSSRVATGDGAPVSVERRRSRTLRVVASVARGGRAFAGTGWHAADIVCEFTATTFKFGLKSEPALRIPEKSSYAKVLNRTIRFGRWRTIAKSD